MGRLFALFRFFSLLVVVKCSSYDYTDVGMWQGDFWVPPDGRVYTPSALHSVLQNRRVLMLGDSLGRRTASTLGLLLAKFAQGDSEDISVAALDSDADQSHATIGTGEHEYMNVSIGGLHFRWAPKFDSIRKEVCAPGASGKLLGGVSDVVIFAGIHDSAAIFLPNTTAIKDDNRRYETHKQSIVSALNCIHGANSTTRVFWRTAPYAYFDYSSGHTHAVNKEVHEVNKIARVECLKRKYCTLVDAEKLLQHRSLGVERINGDSAEHFGSLARLVLIQLVVRAIDLTSTAPL
jgi:hypothetical protein